MTRPDNWGALDEMCTGPCCNDDVPDVETSLKIAHAQIAAAEARAEAAEAERDDYARQLASLTTLQAGTVAIANMRQQQANDAERELFHLRAELKAAEARAERLAGLLQRCHDSSWHGPDCGARFGGPYCRCGLQELNNEIDAALQEPK